MKIVITGAEGLIGWHLRCFLSGQPDTQIIPCRRFEFQENSTLQSLVSQADAVVHLAGMNRGDDAEVEAVNIQLAETLVKALQDSNATPHLVFASSIHAKGDTPYGRSKRRADEIFKNWSHCNNARYTCLVLPHVFGEHGRPFYNSVVHTFCHQLAQNETLTLDNPDGPLELLHAQEVSKRIFDTLLSRETGEIVPGGTPTVVSALAKTLTGLAETYRQNILPDLRHPIHLQLFNTYRSYLYPDHYPVKLQLHTDSRGELFEAVKEHNGGQVFLSTTRPGITRGNHFHLTKVERFLIVNGEAEIRIRRMFDDQVRIFPVHSNPPCFIDIPTLHTHNITNTGSGDLTMLFWSNQIFDANHPDTVPAEV